MTIPGCFEWVIWDTTQVAFGDEVPYPDRRAALAAMKAGAPYIHAPSRYAIVEQVDDERVTYHYYRSTDDGEFLRTHSLPLISRRLHEAEWRAAVRTLILIALGSLTVIVAALAVADWWGVPMWR